MRKLKYGIGAGAVLAFFLGAFSLAGVDGVVHTTNTNEFCTSCHEMAENAYMEYQRTPHYKNVSGVRASCSDCHVPRNWPEKMLAKIRAAKDVYFHFTGKIDTREKYDAHRLRMAETVWRYMKESDSRECRACHALQAMALDEQQGRASRKHSQMRGAAQTCIDCHKGVAHELPSGHEDAPSGADAQDRPSM